MTGDATGPPAQGYLSNLWIVEGSPAKKKSFFFRYHAVGQWARRGRCLIAPWPLVRAPPSGSGHRPMLAQEENRKIGCGTRCGAGVLPPQCDEADALPGRVPRTHPPARAGGRMPAKNFFFLVSQASAARPAAPRGGSSQHTPVLSAYSVGPPAGHALLGY